MTRHGARPRRGHRRPAAALAGVLLLPLGVAGGGQPARAAGAEVTIAGVTVSASETADLTNGQPVRVTVRSPETKVLGAEIKQCRPGVVYQPSRDSLAKAPDFYDRNCPSTPVSTSADLLVTIPGTNTTASPGGDTVRFRVGAADNHEWPNTQVSPPVTETLSCGFGKPCTLVVEVLIAPTGEQARWQPFTFPLQFADESGGFGGCGGADPGVLGTGGSDRMKNTWLTLTIAECQMPGRKAATEFLSLSEGDLPPPSGGTDEEAEEEKGAVGRFASGRLDLAYSAGGYNDDMGLALPGGTRRASVAVPVAINAAVLALAGNTRGPSGRGVPFTDVKLKAGEAAAMLSGGNTSGFDPYEQEIRNRNREFAQSDVFSRADGQKFKGVGIYSAAEATSWYHTRYLRTLAEDNWRVPDEPGFEARGAQRPIDANLARAQPTFDNALLTIELLSGEVKLREVLAPIGSTIGGGWFFTDLATTRRLELTPVQLENAQPGVFVAPTPETLVAAVPDMKRDKHGVLVSDPRVVADAAGQVNPYPMTMVEYALVPAEPLLTADCSERDRSQALLTRWLEYITGDGQNVLTAAGMVPLTAGLRAEAAEAIARVGASPVTGPCQGKVKQAGDQSTPPATPGSGPASTSDPASAGEASGAGGAGGSGAASRSAGATGTGSGPGTDGGSDAAGSPETEPVADVDLPPYGGKRGPALLLAVIALLAIASSSLFASPAPPRWLARVTPRSFPRWRRRAPGTGR